MIYIDDTYNCHFEDDGTRRAFEVSYFDGKCPTYIEGHIYVPEGETLVLDNGVIYKGEVIATISDFQLLAAAQAKYERQELKRLRLENAEYESALSEIEEALGITE